MNRLSLRFLPALAVMIAAAPVAAQTGIAINNDGRGAHASAILDVSSNYAFPTQQKGMLIPRMTRSQRVLLGVTVQSLLVYQTDNFSATEPAGFYYVENSLWQRLDNGANNWDLGGNDITTAANDFFGTRNDVDVTFKTNGITQMTLKGTSTARYLGINTTTPDEVVDINGALRIYQPPGTVNLSNTTTTPGVILYRSVGVVDVGDGFNDVDTLYSTFTPAPIQTRDPLMWNGHWGQTGTTSWNTTGATANSGTWRRLENDYEERFSKSYSQQGSPDCNAGGFVQIPNSVPTVMSTALPAFDAAMASPYPNWNVSAPLTIRVRHQHLYLASELNVEKNQLGINTLGLPAIPAATGGLCPGQPVNSIGFFIGPTVGTLLNNQRSAPTTNFSIVIKHVAFGLNNLSGGFDNSIDPAQACYVQATTAGHPTVISNTWEVFTSLSQPFVWDGVRNVLVEIAYQVGPAAAQTPPVMCAQAPGGLQLTASWNNLSSYPLACGPVGPAGSCTVTTSAAGSVWNSAGVPTPPTNPCGLLGTAGGTSSYRPVVRFGGTVTSATPPLSTGLVNSYLYYRGALLSEYTVSPAPWGRTSPAYIFHGPGTVSAEKGVFDNSARLNDHVFDRAFDGAVKPEDAATFGQERTLDIGEMAAYTQANRHLPTMKGRESWRAERGFSLGDLTNQLWATTETQALYLTELNDRLDVIELLSTDRPLHAEELALAKTNLFRLAAYTDAEKAALAKTLEERTVPTQQR